MAFFLANLILRDRSYPGATQVCVRPIHSIIAGYAMKEHVFHHVIHLISRACDRKINFWNVGRCDEPQYKLCW